MSTHDQERSHERHHRDRQIHEVSHDPYRERHRPPEPAVCPECGVVYQHGAYHWSPRPPGAQEHRCPACRRVTDRFPAGFITLEGEFLAEHREEILQLVRNEAEHARAEHPLERLIEIADQDGKTLITTTDVHLPRRIGDALHAAYRGQLDVQYARDDYQVRVHWHR